MNSISVSSTSPDTGSLDASDEAFHTGGVVTVAAAHSVHDTYSAFLSPLLPVLIENLEITKTAAGILTVFYQGPSLLQPLIGHLGDRVNLRVLVVIAPTLAAIAFTLLGLAPTYGILALLLVVAGLSSAGLHSIGPVLTGQMAGRSLGRAMSIWMVGGELGRTLGPIITVAAVAYLTPRGLPALIPGGLLASLIAYIRIRNLPDRRPTSGQHSRWQESLTQMRPILPALALVISTRALLIMALSSFLPTFMTEQGEGLWVAGISLSIMQAAGVVGALTGGSLSDYLGRRRVLVIMSLAAPLAALVFLYTQGWLRLVLLPVVGFTLLSTTPVVMALVQERVSGGRALANGIYMALNFVITSIAVVMVGAIGDRFSLHAAFMTATIVMMVGVPSVFSLTRHEK